ncbi:MAG TPA: DUF4175 family protein, partial [Candidatus Kapabacteria bacterium]|nr:DUF4175 family protein [Candidatus Kapabacteria bacterium]
MPQELYQELIDRLHQLRHRRERVALGIGLSRSLTLILIIGLLAIGTEAIFHLSITGRTILFFSSLALGLVSIFATAAAPAAEYFGLRQRASYEMIAGLIGKKFTEVEDRLVNVLQLSSELRNQPVAASSFASAAFASTYGSVRHLDFNAIIDERPMRRGLILFFLMLAVSFGSFLIPGGEMSAAANRLTHFRTFYQKPAPFVFFVKPGNTKTLRGEAVQVVIRTKGEQLRTLKLHFREGEAGEFEQIELKARSIDSSATKGAMAMTEFTYELRPQHSTEYFVDARDIESEHFHIEALERPVIKLLSVAITPPAYTRQKSQLLQDNFGDITALAGSAASFQVTSSKPLIAADLVYHPQRLTIADDSTKTIAKPADSVLIYHLTVDGTSAKGNLSLRQPGSYHIVLHDADSIQSEHPIEYTVALTADEAPAIVLLEPSEHSELPSSMRVSMLMKIHDDYGFSSLKLGYRLRASKYVPEEKEYKWISLPMASYSEQDQEVPYVWNLTNLSLSPEDE